MGELRKIGTDKLYLSWEKLESGAIRFWKDITINNILSRSELSKEVNF